jgi:RimJ/RimL family protein N-acetyltransferase
MGGLSLLDARSLCELLASVDPRYERAALRSLQPFIHGHTRSRGVSGDNERMASVLETERLVLRRFTDDDVDSLVELDSDPSVMRFITGGLTTPRSEIEEEVLPAFLRHYARWPAWGFFATEEKVSGKFLGWFHLRPDDRDPDDEVELGYRLRKDAWGEGYATEGARALIDYAFGHGARRVYAGTMVVNVPHAVSWKRPGSGSSAVSTNHGRTGSKARRREMSNTRSCEMSGKPRRGES